MSDNIVHVTDASFETDVLQSDIPALVDFWAEWCGPCKMIAPILDEVSSEYAGKIKICKVDVDSNPETAAKFNVRGIPTLLVFKNGAVEATKVGALSKGQLTEFVDSLSEIAVALRAGPQNFLALCMISAILHSILSLFACSDAQLPSFAPYAALKIPNQISRVQTAQIPSNL